MCAAGDIEKLSVDRIVDLNGLRARPTHFLAGVKNNNIL